MAQTQMDLPLRISLLKQHPCFSSLSSAHLEQLAHLFSEKHFLPGELIVSEGEIVNAVYFIVQGTAEVRQVVSQYEVIPLAVLNPGETIGLGQTGLYSRTGERTATVVAVDHMELLRLDITAFDKFLTEHADVDKALRENVQLFFRMRLIKKALPFKKISMEMTRWLAEQVVEKQFSKNEMIFKKGDVGDFCYLIETGKVEVFTPNENHAKADQAARHEVKLSGDDDQAELHIYELKAGMVLGEAALLTGLPRNASARALEECKVLALSRDLLLKVISKEPNVAKGLLALLKTRSRPLRKPNIECYQRENENKEKIITLKDAKNLNYYRLTEEGFLIWQLINGKNTLRDISIGFYNEYDIFDPGMISAFIMELHDEGFVELTIKEQRKPENLSLMLRLGVFVRSILEVSYQFGQPDKWIFATYQKGVHYFFTRPVRLLFYIVILSGLSLLVLQAPRQVQLLYHYPHPIWILFAIAVFLMITMVFHELAHAYTVKHFGRQVKNFGIGWYWVAPIAFCDTSDMWLSPKQQRVRVDLAGIKLDLFVGSFMAILACFMPNEVLSLFCWLVGVFKLLNSFGNLSPIIEFDGYYALMDYLDRENLKVDAVVWLTNDFPQEWRHPAMIWQKHKALIIYWLCCFVYLIFATIIPYMVLNVLLYRIFGVRHPFLSFLLTLLVLLFSVLAIRADIKKFRLKNR